VLVLDNFEHLPAAAPLVLDMLGAAPKLKALVTSRERLNLRGETVLTLDGLVYPPDERSSISGSAVDLFLQAARRRRSDFQPNDDDRQHVGRICRLVEVAASA
jgi:predicted ATPase